MKSLIVEVPSGGASLELYLSPGIKSAQLVVVMPEGVEIGPRTDSTHGSQWSPGKLTTSVREWLSQNGFPPRGLTEQSIVQILREHRGFVKIRDETTRWNIYDEIAARLGVSIEARRRLTTGTGEPAWRPEVGFARKNLEQQGIIEPTQVSGRGVWKLRP